MVDQEEQGPSIGSGEVDGSSSDGARNAAGETSQHLSTDSPALLSSSWADEMDAILHEQSALSDGEQLPPYGGDSGWSPTRAGQLQQNGSTPHARRRHFSPPRNQNITQPAPGGSRPRYQPTPSCRGYVPLQFGQTGQSNKPGSRPQQPGLRRQSYGNSPPLGGQQRTPNQFAGNGPFRGPPVAPGGGGPWLMGGIPPGFAMPGGHGRVPPFGTFRPHGVNSPPGAAPGSKPSNGQPPFFPPGFPFFPVAGSNVPFPQFPPWGPFGSPYFFPPMPQTNAGGIRDKQNPSEGSSPAGDRNRVASRETHDLPRVQSQVNQDAEKKNSLQKAMHSSATAAGTREDPSFGHPFSDKANSLNFFGINQQFATAASPPPVVGQPTNVPYGYFIPPPPPPPPHFLRPPPPPINHPAASSSITPHPVNKGPVMPFPWPLPYGAFPIAAALKQQPATRTSDKPCTPPPKQSIAASSLSTASANSSPDVSSAGLKKKRTRGRRRRGGKKQGNVTISRSGSAVKSKSHQPKGATASPESSSQARSSAADATQSTSIESLDSDGSPPSLENQEFAPLQSNLHLGKSTDEKPDTRPLPGNGSTQQQQVDAGSGPTEEGDHLGKNQQEANSFDRSALENYWQSYYGQASYTWPMMAPQQWPVQDPRFAHAGGYAVLPHPDLRTLAIGNSQSANNGQHGSGADNEQSLVEPQTGRIGLNLGDNGNEVKSSEGSAARSSFRTSRRASHEHADGAAKALCHDKDESGNGSSSQAASMHQQADSQNDWCDDNCTTTASYTDAIAATEVDSLSELGELQYEEDADTEFPTDSHLLEAAQQPRLPVYNYLPHFQVPCGQHAAYFPAHYPAPQAMYGDNHAVSHHNQPQPADNGQSQQRNVQQATAGQLYVAPNLRERAMAAQQGPQALSQAHCESHDERIRREHFQQQQVQHAYSYCPPLSPIMRGSHAGSGPGSVYPASLPSYQPNGVPSASITSQPSPSCQQQQQAAMMCWSSVSCQNFTDGRGITPPPPLPPPEHENGFQGSPPHECGLPPIWQPTRCNGNDGDQHPFGSNRAPELAPLRRWSN